MSVTFNTNAVKYREEVGDQWAPLTMHVESEVNAVVQDEEPLGSENVWFDTSDETEVQIPTMDDLTNFLKWTKVENLENGHFYPPAGATEFYVEIMANNSSDWQRIGPFLVDSLKDGTHWDGSGGWFYQYVESTNRFTITRSANSTQYPATSIIAYWR